MYTINYIVPSEVIFAMLHLHSAFEGTVKLPTFLRSVIGVDVCVPFISLNKVGRAIMAIIAPDVDVFIPFASVEIQTHDVNITQFGS